MLFSSMFFHTPAYPVVVRDKLRLALLRRIDGIFHLPTTRLALPVDGAFIPCSGGLYRSGSAPLHPSTPSSRGQGFPLGGRASPVLHPAPSLHRLEAVWSVHGTDTANRPQAEHRPTPRQTRHKPGTRQTATTARPSPQGVTSAFLMRPLNRPVMPIVCFFIRLTHGRQWASRANVRALFLSEKHFFLFFWGAKTNISKGGAGKARSPARPRK